MGVEPCGSDHCARCGGHLPGSRGDGTDCRCPYFIWGNTAEGIAIGIGHNVREIWALTAVYYAQRVRDWARRIVRRWVA